MAQVANPRKQFNFNIFVPGLNPYLAQKVTLPDLDIDVTEHGDLNFLVKTGGIQKVGTIRVSKISPADASDTWLADWMREVQDVMVGGGLLPSQYKRSIYVEHYAPDNVTVINTYAFYGCWPSKINGVELSRVDSNNTMEDIEFCVDQFEVL